MMEIVKINPVDSETLTNELTGQMVFKAVLEALGLNDRRQYWPLMVADNYNNFYESAAREITWTLVKHLKLENATPIELVKPGYSKSDYGTVSVTFQFFFKGETHPYVVGRDFPKAMLYSHGGKLLAQQYLPSPMEQFATAFSESMADMARRRKREGQK